MDICRLIETQLSNLKEQVILLLSRTFSLLRANYTLRSPRRYHDLTKLIFLHIIPLRIKVLFRVLVF